MAENKTIATDASVTAFLDKIEDAQLRQDCLGLVEIMGRVSKKNAVMWGSAIIGFGTYHYVYESGREGDISIIGFSPRKQNIAIYLKGGLELFQDELAVLGNYKTGKGCLYIKTLKDIDPVVLGKICAKSYASVKQA